VAVYKEVLYRRGIITSRTCRAPGQVLDGNDCAELDAIMQSVEPLFII
jgi:dihydrodipicolinate synthase/N-acetylneuraminate lyase